MEHYATEEHHTHKAHFRGKTVPPFATKGDCHNVEKSTTDYDPQTHEDKPDD